MTHSQRSAFVQVLLYLCLTVTVSVCLSVWRWLQVSVSELVPLLVLVLHLELVWRRRVRLGLKLHTLGFLLEFTQLLASLQRRLQTNTPWHTHTHLNNRPHEFPVFQQICNHKKSPFMQTSLRETQQRIKCLLSYRKLQRSFSSSNF